MSNDTRLPPIDAPHALPRDLRDVLIQSIAGTVRDVASTSQVAAQEDIPPSQRHMEGLALPNPNSGHSFQAGLSSNANEVNVSKSSVQGSPCDDWNEYINYDLCDGPKIIRTSQEPENFLNAANHELETPDISSLDDVPMDSVRSTSVDESSRYGFEQQTTPHAWMPQPSEPQIGYGSLGSFQGSSDVAASMVFPSAPRDTLPGHVSDASVPMEATPTTWPGEERADAGLHDQAFSSNVPTSMQCPVSSPSHAEVSNAANKPSEPNGYSQPKNSLSFEWEPEQRFQFDPQSTNSTPAGNEDTRHPRATSQGTQGTQRGVQHTRKNKASRKAHTPAPILSEVFTGPSLTRPPSPFATGAITKKEFGVTSDGIDLLSVASNHHQIVSTLGPLVPTKFPSSEGSFVFDNGPIWNSGTPQTFSTTGPITFHRPHIYVDQSPRIINTVPSTLSAPEIRSNHDNPVPRSGAEPIEEDPVAISSPPPNTLQDTLHQEIQVSSDLTRQKGTRKRAGEPQMSERAKIRHSEASSSQTSPLSASLKRLSFLPYTGPSTSSTPEGGSVKTTHPKGHPTEQQLRDPEYLNRAHGCTSCPARFKRTDGLQRHVRTYHEHEIVWVCPVQGCGEGRTRKDNGYQHLKLYHDDTCPQCGVVFDRSQELDEHLRGPPH